MNTATTSSTLPILQYGDSGLAVKVLQRLLVTAGIGYATIDLSVDGVFGDKTQAQVKRFQLSQGLSQDGVVGSNTWQALTNPQQ